MNKKWLALGLAAMMSFACLTACGDNGDNNGNNNGDGNNGGNVIKGEQVTKEQWDAAFENIDYTYVVEEIEEYGNEYITSGNEIWTEYKKTVTYDKTKYYYDKNVSQSELDGTETEIYEEWRVKTDDSNVYVYRKEQEGEEIETDDWHSDVYKNFTEINKEYLEWQWDYNHGFFFNLNNTIFSQKIEDFIFDESRGVYYQEYKVTYEDEDYYSHDIFTVTETERWEVTFIDGKVYSIKASDGYIDVAEDGTEEKGERSYLVIFKQEAITLPDEEGLNALIEQNA